MKKIIVFDIDGTLSIVGDRLKYLEKKDWNSFYDACGEDFPNVPLMALFDSLIQDGNFKIVLVSGRRETCRYDTIIWLKKYSKFYSQAPIYLRRNGDMRPDTIVKMELCKDFIDDIFMVFEDRTSMVNMWRDRGVTCLQVNKGDF